MDKKVKWGILGYARIAKNSIIPAILKSNNAEFYAIASRDESKLKECKELFGCKKLYTNYEELLEDPDVEIVYIPLPNNMHKEMTIIAAKNGKNILCEKPAALKWEDCKEMIEICKENNVKFMEGFMYRYTNRTQKVLELIKSGEIGEIKYINSSYRFFLDRPESIKWKPELGGGSLYDVGCYPINFIGMILNDTPVSVTNTYILHNDIDISFTGVLKYKSGAICTINSGFNSYKRNFSEIIGTKGIIEIPDTFMGSSGNISIITDSGNRSVYVEESDRYLLEVTEFTRDVAEDRIPMITMEETLRNSLIMDMLQNKTK